MKTVLDCMSLSSVTTWAGVVRSDRDSPEPSLSWGWMPKLEASWARMTAAPAAVVPPLPKRAPRSLVSISAKKLSDGVLVSEISVAIRGEPAEASVWAAAGSAPRSRGRGAAP